MHMKFVSQEVEHSLSLLIGMMIMAAIGKFQKSMIFQRKLKLTVMSLSVDKILCFTLLLSIIIFELMTHNLDLLQSFFLQFMESKKIKLIMVLSGKFTVLIKKMVKIFIMEIKLDLNMILLANMSVLMAAVFIQKEIADVDVQLLDNQNFMQLIMGIILSTLFSKLSEHYLLINKLLTKIFNCKKLDLIIFALFKNKIFIESKYFLQVGFI